MLSMGSSIMPGKTNPVIAEALCQVAAEVIGNDATIAVAGARGTFEITTLPPVAAFALLESIELLALRIGYDAAPAVAAEARTSGRTVREVTRGRTGLGDDELAVLLDARRTTGPPLQP